jgi:hypothetical protein
MGFFLKFLILLGGHCIPNRQSLMVLSADPVAMIWLSGEMAIAWIAPWCSVSLNLG